MRTLRPMRQFLSMMAPSMYVPSPTPSGGLPLAVVAGNGVGRLVEIVAHQDRVANDHVAADAAPQADHAVLDHRPGLDHRAVGHQAAADRRPVDPRRRQEAGVRVDRRLDRRQIERRVGLGQIARFAS